MTWRKINSQKLAKPFGVFSQGVKWISKNETFIFISGMTSKDKNGQVVGVGDIKKQTIQAMENIKEVLSETHGNIEDIVKVTVYVKDINYLKEIHEIRSRYWKDSNRYPASTLIEVSRFVNDEYMIEIEAIAIIKNT